MLESSNSKKRSHVQILKNIGSNTEPLGMQNNISSQRVKEELILVLNYLQLGNLKYVREIHNHIHSVKSVGIWSYSGPYFPAFGLNTERYGVSHRIQSECGKMRTRITPNTDTFYAVIDIHGAWPKIRLKSKI